MVPIRLTQLLHVTQFALQGTLMAGLVHWAGRGLAAVPGPQGGQPELGPYALLAFLLILMVGSSLYAISPYLRPDLQRPIRENRRVYRSRQLLRNSLLGLLGLPPLLLYQTSGDVVHLGYYALMLLGLTGLTWPTQHRYQRWLLAPRRARK